MVDILKSSCTSIPLFNCFVMFSMVHELNCNMKACFRGCWNIISASCNIDVQLAGMNKIRILGYLVFIYIRNSSDLCTNQQSINQISC
jgi:hypothetical protein